MLRGYNYRKFEVYTFAQKEKKVKARIFFLNYITWNFANLEKATWPTVVETEQIFKSLIGRQNFLKIVKPKVLASASLGLDEVC